MLRPLLSATLLVSVSLAHAVTPPTAPASLYDFSVKRINSPGKDRETISLSAYRGKVLLVVNTASECGYTSQYKGLQTIATKYRPEGFEVLGFPSNDYGAQEPGTNAEIKNFCERQFKVDFPLFEKAPVSGNRIQPVYAYLTENAPKKGAVGWNFEKFLIDRDGKIIGRYKSGVTPESDELTGAIRAALAAKPVAAATSPAPLKPAKK